MKNISKQTREEIIEELRDIGEVLRKKGLTIPQIRAKVIELVSVTY